MYDDMGTLWQQYYRSPVWILLAVTCMWSSHVCICSGQNEISQLCDGSCEVGYLTQPVKELTCDPYRGFNEIQLGCSVYGPPSDSIGILWFRVLDRSPTSEPELLTDDTPGIRINPDLLRGESPSDDQALEINNISPQDAGVYWCQVSFNGSSEELGPSQQLLLRLPEEYAMFPPCPLRVYTAETRCAVETGNATTTENSTQVDSATEVGECRFLYLAQPPQSLPCNPYRPEFNELQLECNVVRPPGVTYEIQWFRQQDNVSTLLTDDLDRIQVNNETYPHGITRSRLTLFRLIEEEDVGLYWCQIVEFEGNTTKQLQPSVFTVLNKSEVYNNCAVCPDVYLFTVETECAEVVAITSSTPSPPPTVPEPTTPDTSNDTSNPLWLYIAVSIGGLVVLVLATCGVIATIKFLKWKRKKDSISKQRTGLTHNVSYPHSYTSQAVHSAYDYPSIYASISNGNRYGQPPDGYDPEYASGYVVPDGAEPQRNHDSTTGSTYQSLSTSSQDYMSVYMKAFGSESSLKSFGKLSTQDLVREESQYTLPDPSRMDPSPTYTSTS